MNTVKEAFSYKDYFGSAEVSQEDRCLVGRVLFIDDLVMYEGDTVDELERAFRSSVDDYLAFCLEQGKTPSKAYSGTFNVRVGPDLHSAAARKASQANTSLNEFVRNAIYVAVFHSDKRSEQKTSSVPTTSTYWIGGEYFFSAHGSGISVPQTVAGSVALLEGKIALQEDKFLRFGAGPYTQPEAQEVH